MKRKMRVVEVFLNTISGKLEKSEMYLYANIYIIP